MPRRRLAALTAPLLLALVACGASREATSTSTAPASTPSSSTPAKAAPKPEPKATPTSRCTPASRELLDRIARGALDGMVLNLPEGAVFRSPDHARVYYVAAKLVTPGVEEEAIFATNDLDAGITLAVDGFAQEFTVWPHGDKVAAGVRSTDPGARVASDCLS